MKKPKVLGIGSQSYPEGRIDSFELPLIQGIHQFIVSLFIDLGLSKEESRDELELDFENKEMYPAGTSFFIYVSKELKAYLIIGDKNISLRLDTTFPREKIVRILERHFNFPE